MSDVVFLWGVSSYHDEPGIRRCVETLFEANDTLLGPLRAAGPDALAVVKPNWVQESHEYDPDLWEPVITHPSLVLSVVDVLAEKMNGIGTLCVCDAPNTYANFDRIVARGAFRGRLDLIRARWPQLKIEVIDLRREVWQTKEEVIVARHRNAPDPRGYTEFNLGADSLFFDFPGEGRYYGADYDSAVVNQHHHGATHEYLLSGTAAACDLFVNLPKLKTHKKTGITCSLKNLVGINGDKNWLPHHTAGTPRVGGDEFPTDSAAHRLERTLKGVGRKIALGAPLVGTYLYRKMRNAGKAVLGDSRTTIRNGNWIGNSTCWRMVLDLNRALSYGNRDGTWRQDASVRPYLTLIDGIVGGEGDGPLCPDPVDSRVLVGGSNTACVDAVASRLMGYDPAAIPVVARAFDPHRWPLGRIPLGECRVYDARTGSYVGLDEVLPAVEGGFKPHFGWQSLARVP